MTYKSIIVFSCLVISSCKTAPISVDSNNSNQSPIPQFDYDTEQSKYMDRHRFEIDKKNVSKTLNNARSSIKNYLKTVGEINECSKYTIESRNLASPRQLAKPVNVNNAKDIAETFAKKAKDYATSMDAKFNWVWNNGADIQAGKNSIDKVMGSLHFEAELKYTFCRTAENSLENPTLQVITSNYEIIFTKGSVSQLATKASAIFRGECGKELDGFNFFPNGYEQLAFNTFNHSSMGIVTQSYTNKNSNVYYNDKKRYSEAYRGNSISKLFKTSPCDNFKKEYYKLLNNADVKFQKS